MDKTKLEALLARARAAAHASQSLEVAAKLDHIEKESNAGTTIDLSQAGISDESLATDEGLDAAADTLHEMLEEPAIQDAANDKDSLQGQQNAHEHEHEHTEDKIKSNLGVARTDIVYNENQQRYVDAVVHARLDEKDCKVVVLVGAAGTGKTTCQRGAAEGLIASGRIKNIGDGTKWLRSGLPGAIIVSYTRKAVNNIRHAMPDILKPHTLTIHKVLEFAPFYYEVEDLANPGKFKKTMRFEPTRNHLNPLPSALQFIGFEESSMVSVELYDLLMDALPHPEEVQMSFLGDIQQLPPIFGSAILGFKMLEEPIIELTDVYRQALDSPIISLAWDILRGDPRKFDSSIMKREKIYNPIVKKELERVSVGALDAFNVPDKLKIHYLQKKISADLALLTLTKQFNDWSDAGFYNPQEDIILIPFNKAFGTIELNKGIQQHLGVKREAVVHEVIAGFNKHYLAIGDRVLYDKEDAFIIDIARNSEYLGKSFQNASKYLDRWGHLRADDALDTQPETEADSEFDLKSIDKYLEHAANADEDRVNSASHVVTVRLAHTDEEFELESAQDVNNLIGGNAITVHKAQGSEWERVFFIMHQSHAVMNQRELLYTAVTRARSFLYVLCETDTFEKGIQSQRIVGNTLAEKAEFFKGKKKEYESKKELLAAERAANDVNAIAKKISGKNAVRISDLVPEDVKQLIENRTKECWNQALVIWKTQAEKLGIEPVISFELGSRRVLGMAHLTSNKIRYNPVWLGCGDAEVLSHFMQETVPHEVCHHIAYRLFKDRGHGYWWKDCMRKMGLPANRISSKQMPAYFEAKEKRLQELFASFNVPAVPTNSETDNEGDTDA